MKSRLVVLINRKFKVGEAFQSLFNSYWTAFFGFGFGFWVLGFVDKVIWVPQNDPVDFHWQFNV